MTNGPKYHPFNPLASAAGRGRKDSRKVLVEAMTEPFTVDELPDVVSNRTKYRVIDQAVERECIEPFVDEDDHRVTRYRMTTHGEACRLEGIHTMYECLVDLYHQNGASEPDARDQARNDIAILWDMSNEMVPVERAKDAPRMATSLERANQLVTELRND